MRLPPTALLARHATRCVDASLRDDRHRHRCSGREQQREREDRCEHRRRHRGESSSCGDAIRELVDLALLRHRSFELVVQLLDLVDDLGRLAQVGGCRVGRGLLRRRGGDPLGCRPQSALVDAGEQRDALADRIDRGEVVRADDQVAPRRVGVEAGSAQQIDLAPGADELVAHVLGGRHVDHPMPLALRAEDREVAAGGVAELEVDAGAAAAERADDLADEAVALSRPEAGDDGQPGMEVERERAAARLDDDSLALHQPSDRQAGRRS